MAKSFEIKEEGFPDLPAMMLATIRALKSIGGSASLHELDETVVEQEDISEEEQAFFMPNGRDRKINYYLAWARTYLKKGGALDNSSRGVWALTEEGEKITNQAEAKQLYKEVYASEVEKSRKRREKKKQEQKIVESESEVVELSDISEPVSEVWQEKLLEVLLSMDPAAFERLSQRLLREAGFTKVEVRGKTGDGGIDGVGVLRVNLVSFQVYFQCKRWKGSVGAKEIRDFRGALQGRADKGLFVTTGSFTTQASEEATRDGAIAIDLIDGDRLCDLLKQFDLGVSTKMIEEVEIYEEFFHSV